jgi:flagellar biosynthesis protein
MAAIDPQQLAVALAYREDEGAPRVVAKGRGLLAEAILARAREAGVYVHESPELVALLMQVDLDSRIPPQLYIAVAELLAWLYRLERGETLAPPVPSLPPKT